MLIVLVAILIVVVAFIIVSRGDGVSDSKRGRKTLFRILLWLGTVGWLYPAYISASSYFGYQRVEVQAFIWEGSSKITTSWPYLGYAESFFEIAFCWFAVAASGWSFYLVSRVVTLKKREDKA